MRLSDQDMEGPVRASQEVVQQSQWGMEERELTGTHEMTKMIDGPDGGPTGMKTRKVHRERRAGSE